MGEVVPLRKQKLVSVCGPENRARDKIQYSHHHVAPSATQLYTYAKIPINSHNLLMLEIYPESRNSSDNLPCTKLNFMSLCYEPGTRVSDMRYSFGHEYDLVKVVDFTGPIRSMRLAFELLQNFKSCKGVVFVINNDNVQFTHGCRENMDDLQKNWNVETVRIVHDFSVVEKSALEAQSGAWRLDEILTGCLSFPKLHKFHVSIFGNGSNYDKVNKFVTGHHILNTCYAVEISNEKVKCKPKHHPRSLSVNSSSVSPSMDLAKIPPVIPVDMSTVKKESVSEVEEQALVCSNMSASFLHGFPKFTEEECRGSAAQHPMNSPDNFPSVFSSDIDDKNAGNRMQLQILQSSASSCEYPAVTEETVDPKNSPEAANDIISHSELTADVTKTHSDNKDDCQGSPTSGAPSLHVKSERSDGNTTDVVAEESDLEEDDKKKRFNPRLAYKQKRFFVDKERRGRRRDYSRSRSSRSASTADSSRRYYRNKDRGSNELYSGSRRRSREHHGRSPKSKSPVSQVSRNPSMSYQMCGNDNQQSDEQNRTHYHPDHHYFNPNDPRLIRRNNHQRNMIWENRIPNNNN